MDRKRKVYAPFSQTSEAGVTQTPVEGYIDVNQTIYPTVQTGVVNEKGQWTGVKSSDTEFIELQKDEAIANGAEVLSVRAIDMTHHDLLMFAVKPSNGGNFKYELLLSGTETGNDSYFNLRPIKTDLSAFTTLRTDAETHKFDFILDVTHGIDADVWSVFKVNDCRGYKLILKITNNSGGNSDIEQAYMRVV